MGRALSCRGSRELLRPPPRDNPVRRDLKGTVAARGARETWPHVPALSL